MFDSYRYIRRVALVATVSLAGSQGLSAQTDYYNTDRGRPVQIEDAYSTERHAFELKVAPIRLERSRGPVYNWTAEPEIAYGILPRTHVEIGVPLVYTDVAGARTRGLAGLDLSAFHSFNVETETFPAFALRADVLAPVGSLAPDKAYPSLTGLMTRTFSWIRIHANGQYTFGSAPAASTGAAGSEVSRWLAGAAVDKTYPLKSMLLTAEFYARGPFESSEDMEYNAGTGIRYQWSPTLALDFGVGRRLSGADPAWYVTFGSAYAFAVKALIPGAGR
jgi:hypothetical protein